MEEGISIRALTIGVSIFIAIATMTLVITYYSTARQSVAKVGTGIDISVAYDRKIDTILTLASPSNYNLTGTDVKNLLNYYYMEGNVIINITKLKYLDNSGSVLDVNMYGTNSSKYQNIGNDKSKYENAMKILISNQYFRLDKIQDQNTLTLNITGDQ